MALFDNAISYVEHIPGSPEERIEQDGSSATRVLDVNWSDRQSAARYILGYPEVVRATSYYISRNLPLPHPAWVNPTTGYPFLWATKIPRIQGIGRVGVPGTSQKLTNGLGDVAIYKTARMTVHHETLTYDILADNDPLMPKDANGWPDESSLKRYVTKKVFPAAQYITLTTGSCKYAANPVANPLLPCANGLGKMLVNFNVSLTWHQIPDSAIPCSLFSTNSIAAGQGNIELSLGRINKAAFAGFNKGTLLLMACDIKPLRSPHADRLYDITYMFKYFEPNDIALALPDGTHGTHTHVFRPPPPGSGSVAGIWTEVSSDGAVNLSTQTRGKSLYDWADFTLLFKAQ